MFEASHGMSQQEYFVNGGAATHNILEATPNFYASDAGSLSSLSESASSEDEELYGAAPVAAWRSGERERDAARTAKRWPDGEPVGRGHDSPYLKERWAKAIATGVKKVEGRPDEGVRCRPPHHPSYPNHPIC